MRLGFEDWTTGLLCISIGPLSPLIFLCSVPKTYEPSVSAEKRIRNINKYIHQDRIGFRITGFKRYDQRSGEFVSKDKYFGRSLQPDQVRSGLEQFFSDGVRVRKDVVMIVLQRLNRLWRWASKQNTFHFYCSSILVTYDGLNASEDLQGSLEKYVDVRIIDFAHTLPAEGVADEGYIFGVKSLISHLEMIVSN